MDRKNKKPDDVRFGKTVVGIKNNTKNPWVTGPYLPSAFVSCLRDRIQVFSEKEVCAKGKKEAIRKLKICGEGGKENKRLRA